jgi:ketohexokinase
MVECIKYMREHRSSPTTISVEVEKPGREGLIDMALLADFVFFSRGWAMVSCHNKSKARGYQRNMN